MIILDTDTLSIVQRPGSAAVTLRRRMAEVPSDEHVATTIISYEEQTRGWFAYLAKARTSQARIEAYARLLKHLDNWRQMNALPFDDHSNAEFERLQQERLRLEAADLKIAAITLANNALLLSRNLKDFGKIKGLGIDDWTRD